MDITVGCPVRGCGQTCDAIDYDRPPGIGDCVRLAVIHYSAGKRSARSHSVLQAACELMEARAQAARPNFPPLVRSVARIL